MTSRLLSQKQFVPVPPDKGSFPLDHEGVCKKYMVKYMICLHENGKNNTACRQLAKEYLSCRMDNNLMARDEWKKLGFHEDFDSNGKDVEEKPKNI